MSDLKILSVSPDKLRPYPGNARTHSRKQIRQIADSIERFGFVNPILVSADFEIIAGHGRWLAAKLLKGKFHSKVSSTARLRYQFRCARQAMPPRRSRSTRCK